MNGNLESPTGVLAATLIGHSGRHYEVEEKELNKILKENSKRTGQRRALEWLRDHVNPNIPHWYYNLVLGHDVHLTMWADLRARVYRASEGVWEHPYKPGLWLPNNDFAPVIARKKVTVAFRNDIVDNLVADTTAFGDYKFHEVGTDNTGEDNGDIALAATSGIARATGTQVEAAADQYRSVGTITADTGETWVEHGLFNASTGPTLMDRSVFAGIAVLINDQVQFTYTITFNAEA
jgi:hypothetical protein